MSLRAKTRIAEGEDFVMHTLSLRQSPAWLARSHTAMDVLERLELEHMLHGGAENGRLICTYDQFEAAGVRRKSVKGALDELVALGFVEVTEIGRRAAGGYNSCSRYRLTYVKSCRRAGQHKATPPTDEWKRITTAEGAQSAVEKIVRPRRSVEAVPQQVPRDHRTA